VRALELLRRDGLIEQVQGRGTFVRRRTTPDPSSELERLGAWLSTHNPST
jgi:DNA-binding GntR family transcriptional regulator